MIKHLRFFKFKKDNMRKGFWQTQKKKDEKKFSDLFFFPLLIS